MLRQLLLSAVLIMAGCGTTPIAYTPQDSYALNIARAAGIDAKLKDTELPKDTVSDITDSSGFGFALAATSKHLPEWIYFYVAPNKVFVGREQPIKVPLLVQQGQIHYFVKATSSAEQ